MSLPVMEVDPSGKIPVQKGNHGLAVRGGGEDRGEG